MKRKIIVMILSLSLMLVGLTSVVGGVGNERRGFKETESEGSSNFEVVINTPENGQVFQEDEKVNVEYVVENTGDVEDTQEIVSTVNGEKINVTEMTIGPEMSRIGYTEFNASYWAEQFEITEVRLDLIDSPDFVELGDYFEATGQGHYAYLFPETDEVALKEDHLEDYRFTIRNESDILVEVPAEDIELTPKENYSTFEGSVPTEGLEKGDYTLQLEALEKNMQYYESISKNLTLVESTSDHEERIISEGIDFLKMERNPSREEFEIGLENMEEEEALEIKVSSEDDEDSVTVSISEEGEIEEIYDWYDLDEVRDALDGDYVLMNDLDEETDGYDGLVDTEEGWEPIGEYDEENEEFVSFSGSFDGNGHEIREIYINRPAEEHVGLFGTSEGKIENVGILDAEVNGYWFVGSLVGSNSYGTVQNSYAIGEVSGDGAVGGLVGSNTYGRVDFSFTDGEVEGEESIGGLVGYQGGGPGPGWAFTENSYSLTDVSGEKEIGGLVGSNHHSKINSSYAAGEVEGEEDVGGLVGIIGLGGPADIEYSYWDVDTTGQDESDGGTGLTTDEMTGGEALDNIDGFDFEETWETVKEDDEDADDDGYPILQELNREEQLKAQGVYVEEEENDDIPGFTPTLLLLAAVVAFAIYKKKQR